MAAAAAAADEVDKQEEGQEEEQVPGGEEQAQQEGGTLAKKPPGTWTPMETLRLIEAYQEKWYALKRGQLRTRHWEEVAESLAARCAGHLDATEKSSVQCRHKLEKLRRKYRAERQTFFRKGPGSSRWPFFEPMDIMERGPAAAVLEASKNALLDSDLDFHKRVEASKHRQREMPEHDSMSLDEDAEDSDQPPPNMIPTNCHRHHLHYHNHHQDGHLDDNDGSYSSLNRKHSHYSSVATVLNKTDDYRNLRTSSRFNLENCSPAATMAAPDSTPLVELVSVIRSLSEGFLRMEQMKVQMHRESERLRADMELRRTEMVLNSQKQIAELFSRALASDKKSKKPHSSAV